jgi:hypothetical protein
MVVRRRDEGSGAAVPRWQNGGAMFGWLSEASSSGLAARDPQARDYEPRWLGFVVTDDYGWMNGVSAIHQSFDRVRSTPGVLEQRTPAAVNRDSDIGFPSIEAVIHRCCANQ